VEAAVCDTSRQVGLVQNLAARIAVNLAARLLHPIAIAGLRFGKLVDGMVPQIVEAQACKGTLYLLKICLAL
jgi:hypothetical protein